MARAGVRIGAAVVAVGVAAYLASCGRGLRARLLVDALRRALRAAEAVGAFAVEVLARSEEARALYGHFGLRSLVDDPLHLYLPMKTVRNVLEQVGFAVRVRPHASQACGHAPDPRRAFARPTSGGGQGA